MVLPKSSLRAPIDDLSDVNYIKCQLRQKYIDIMSYIGQRFNSFNTMFCDRGFVYFQIQKGIKFSKERLKFLFFGSHLLITIDVIETNVYFGIRTKW